MSSYRLLSLQRLCFLASIFLLFSCKVYADFAVDFKAYPLIIEIQDQVIVELHLTYPETYTYDLETLEGHLLGNTALAVAPFSLFSKKTTQSTSSKLGHLEDTITFILSPQLFGTYPLSFFEIPFTPKDKIIPTDDATSRDTTVRDAATSVKLISPLFQITITNPSLTHQVSAPPSLPTLSYTPPLELNSKNKEKSLNTSYNIENSGNTFLSSLFFCLLAMIIFLLGNEKFLHLINHIKNRNKDKPQDIQKSKRDYLLRLLKRNMPNTPPSNINPSEHYLKITDAIRSIFEDRTSFNVYSATAEEFSKELSHITLNEELKTTLHHIFLIEEKIKFSGYNPTPEDIEEVNATGLALAIIPAEL